VPPALEAAKLLLPASTESTILVQYLPRCAGLNASALIITDPTAAFAVCGFVVLANRVCVFCSQQGSQYEIIACAANSTWETITTASLACWLFFKSASDEQPSSTNLKRNYQT
jgi:hypothetical protein